MASNTDGKYLEVLSESAILDNKITRNEIRYVHQCLGKVSKDWYTIGIHLQLPKAMLDTIELDEPKLTSKLLAMIDAWICNKSDQCTWRTLATALYELGHSAAATAVREKAKEVVTKCKQENEALPRAAGHDEIDPTLTARNIVHALDGLSPYWKAIGNGLNIPENILMRIAKEYSDDDRRFLEVILHWLSSNQHCSWENIKHAVNKLEKSEYVERIDAYIIDWEGILEHHRSGPHDRQLLPKSDTCYKEWWLKRVEFELDPLSRKIYEMDLKDIHGVINKYDPTKWKIIGQDLALLKSELDKIEIDRHDTETRLQEMISTWINMDGRTWQELVDVLRNPKYNKAAADAMIEVARNRPKQQHTGVPYVEEKKYKSLHDHQEKEKCKSEKISATKKLRELLKVASTVSDKDLIEELASHLKKANLTQDQLKEVVRAIERLEQTMKEYSKELKEWASFLKKDLKTAKNFKRDLTKRNQELERLKEKLEEENETINTKLFSDIHKESSFLQKTITRNRLQDHRLETQNKLKHVNDEIQSSLTEIELANTDYTRISNKLNECQIELEKCVMEYKRFHSAIEEVANENLLDWLTYQGAAIGASVGASVGAAVGGVTGSALGPIGTIAGLGVGVAAGLEIGGFIGGLTGIIYGARNREQKDQCKKLIDSCVSCVEELEKQQHELQTIQDQLNDANTSF